MIHIIQNHIRVMLTIPAGVGKQSICHSHSFIKPFHLFHLSVGPDVCKIIFISSGCWEQRNGYYVQEGHGQVNECYDTLETAKRFCLSAGDCKAIATQSNICSGKYRVTHGDPTFISYGAWKQYNLKAYEYMCYSGTFLW